MTTIRRARSSSGNRHRAAAKAHGHPVPRRAASRKIAGGTAGGPSSKSERSRDLILESAARLFRRQGFSATTLREIAAKARIKAGSIYYYFDSKEAILDEVLDRGLRHVFESVKAAVEGAGRVSHRRRIGLAIEAHLVALLETSDFTSANIRIYGQLPEHLKKPQRPLRRAYARYWDQLFLKARRAGEIRADIEIVPLRIFVLGALNWTIEWFRLDSKDAVLKLARRTELLIFEGITKL
jgi:TetR/AcrR family transcriptional regulator, cholesterol catabolism regulator